MTPPNDASPELRSTKRPQPLVRTTTHQRLQTETNSVGVGLRADGEPGLAEQILVDVQRLLHTYDYAMSIRHVCMSATATETKP